MADYATYLKELLRELGVYDLSEGSYNGSELAAAGEALDQVSDLLEEGEREAILVTAEGAGLDRWAALFDLCPVDAGPALRRKALTALLQMGGDSFTLAAINAAIQGCGIKAKVEEKEEWGHIRILFPATAGIPEGFEQIERVILELIPCHLETEFYFRYLTWAECEQQGFTWEMLHDGAYTWERFELAVPEE